MRSDYAYEDLSGRPRLHALGVPPGAALHDPDAVGKRRERAEQHAHGRPF